ncbi:helix-turn-helix transcriptional regulator [bacterium AH-315-F18]|nr:helix-turn-helix transcriptional regulator [bacterium AH-315-F18]
MPNDQRIELGEQIRRQRTSQDITINGLAEKSGVSAGYISEVERGGSAISIEKLRKIAGALDINITFLIDPAAQQQAELSAGPVNIPHGLSEAARDLGLSFQDTMRLLEGKRSLVARRSNSTPKNWTAQEWIEFYRKVKDFLPED